MTLGAWATNRLLPWVNVVSIHQVELTSRCNLACAYCVHPIMKRPKIDMDHETFLACLKWAKHFAQQGTQPEFNLCGIGESTLHPRFVEYVALAREAVGPNVDVVFATNGLLMTEELAKELAPYKPKIGVSLHRSEFAGPAIEILKRHGLLCWAGADAATSAVNWAGQVQWHVSAPGMQCMWVRGGRVFVLADGTVSSCCFDGTGDEPITTIKEFDPSHHFTRPFKLCKTCHQNIDIEGYDQRA